MVDEVDGGGPSKSEKVVAEWGWTYDAMKNGLATIPRRPGYGRWRARHDSNAVCASLPREKMVVG